MAARNSGSLARGYLRSLLVHGARAMLRTAKGKDDRLSRRVCRLAERSHVACVALADKMHPSLSAGSRTKCSWRVFEYAV